MQFKTGDRVKIRDNSAWNGKPGTVVEVDSAHTHPYCVWLDMYKHDEDLRYWFPVYELEKE